MKRIFYVMLVVLVLISFSTLATAQEKKKEEEKSKLNAGTFSGLKFRAIGAAFMSGRISDLAVDPTDKSTWYLAVASGSVFKTTNSGTTWSPIFDRYGSYSIGCVTVDPNNPHTVWVGTGENNSQRSVGYGDGVYKSTDGGKSFKNVGLKDSQHIGMIKVDPRDSNVVYVAAQGPLWNSGGDRGLYKTVDGGATWEKVLEISENTGVNEVFLDPRDPDVLYASAYQRRRHTWVLLNGGPESGLYKSFDAGKTWKKINKGLPGGDKGKIGLAVSPINPDVIYAVVEADPSVEGFFRSDDAGESWRKVGPYVGGSPQYYNEIVADPHKFGRIYALDTYMMVSEDNGKTFNRLGEQWKHVDNHALYIDPDDENHLVIGCDGGLYETWDRGNNYKYFTNLSLSQYYKVALDNALPFYNVYGGTQDNATHGGPSRTDNIHGIRNSDWIVTVFGDGFDPAVDPENPDIVYSQWQNGGLIRYDKKSGEAIDIRPQPEPGEDPSRWNWDAAIKISPHSNTRIYYGSQRLYRTDDRGDSWKPVSPDLTRTEVDRNKLEVMDRVWSVDAVAKNNSTSVFSNIVIISESPVQEGILYVGTDDGLVQVSADDGATWTRHDTFPDVPDMAYIHDIEADMFDANTVYVAINNHKKGDFKPYVLKSTDLGVTWTSITGNLPERGSVYSLKQDHVNKDLLFCGTEFGVFFTINGGEKWIQLKGGLPTIAIRDMEIQRRENDLVLASFGRGFFILDDYTPLRTISEEVLNEEAAMFTMKKAYLYVPKTPLSGSIKGYQGEDFFTADNPPYGAIITYYLKDSYTTRKQRRWKEEGKVKKEDGDNFYPPWEELKLEDREENPAIIFTIKDSAGNVVDRFTARAGAGFNRVNWELRYPSIFPISTGGRGFRRGGGAGPFVTPGKYTVSMAKRVDSELVEFGLTQEFEVEPFNNYAIPPQDRVEVLAFQKKAAELARAVMGANAVAQEASGRVDALRQALLKTPGADTAWDSELRALELRLMDLREVMNGDRTKPRRSELAPPSLMSRLQSALFGNIGTTYGPTGTHRRQFEIAAEQFEAVLADLKKFVEVDLPAFEEKMEAVGAPWTPGRKIPDWKK